MGKARKPPERRCLNVASHHRYRSVSSSAMPSVHAAMSSALIVPAERCRHIGNAFG
jgi:hypothetical protein